MDDGYKRLLAPSLETELRGSLRQQAEKEAITVFTQNLRQLLLASPLGQKRVLAIDPGFRTGCKIVCLDAQGSLLHHDLIHVMSDEQQKSAGRKICSLIEKYTPEAIAIGNGTAGRETETLVRSLGLSLPVIMVSESGASVYSASEIARQEFPDLDLTVRGAISIGRRLMDPLAELVKIDPKAIGVGQYQHDVDQTELKKSLTDVVESCVNAVGVELNTASVELLTHVSGLGPALAKSVVSYREANGPFARRKDLQKV
ncbi:helix-hairpin-helix domain-containing protein, partial [Oceanispirochaeta sp. M1]|uniref:helix-hairpin-helix domain-containing protein n=1 Tax=Oceanispirochaeta sp. M1 TaxID=2283433 RepID=UPI001F1CC69D